MMRLPFDMPWMVVFAVLFTIAGSIAYCIINERAAIRNSRRTGEAARRLSDAWSEYYRLAAHKTTVYFKDGATKVYQSMIGRTGTDGKLYLSSPMTPMQMQGGTYCVLLSKQQVFTPDEFESFKVQDEDGWQI
jgi:hypothetical protein